MDTYRKRRSWSDQFLETVQRIVGEHLVEPSPAEYDIERASDLTVMRAKPVHIAVRVRRHKYLEKYGGEFTIRSKVLNGHDSELEKVKCGFADMMFYGFAAESGPPDLAQWTLLNLNLFRRQLICNAGRRQLRTGVKTNHDGTALRWFALDSLQSNVIIAQSRPERDEAQGLLF
mgnify:CR=1 FL=1